MGDWLASGLVPSDSTQMADAVWSGGKVGMIGSSYDGWTVAMALLDPHPATVELLACMHGHLTNWDSAP